MSEAKYYEEMIRTGKITPNLVERKIAELATELDDSKFFKKAPEIIAKLEARIDELRKVLEKDFTIVRVAAADTLKQVATAIAPTTKPAKAEKKLTELYDGTRLTDAESAEVMELLKKVENGSLSKATIIDSMLSLDPAIAKAKRREDPELVNLQWKKLMLQHVIMTGNFAKIRRRRRNPDADLRALEVRLQNDPNDVEARIALYNSYWRIGTRPVYKKSLDPKLKWVIKPFDEYIGALFKSITLKEALKRANFRLVQSITPAFDEDYYAPGEDSDLDLKWLVANTGIMHDWDKSTPILDQTFQDNHTITSFTVYRTSTGYGVRFAKWYSRIATSLGFNYHQGTTAEKVATDILESGPQAYYGYPSNFAAENCMVRVSYWERQLPSVEEFARIIQG